MAVDGDLNGDSIGGLPLSSRASVKLSVDNSSQLIASQPISGGHGGSDDSIGVLSLAGGASGNFPLDDSSKLIASQPISGSGGCGGSCGRRLLATCHANIAAVRLKQELWVAAEYACGVALTHLASSDPDSADADPDSASGARAAAAAAIKVYFRRGQARERLRKPTLAAVDFRAGAAAAAALVDLAVAHARACGTSPMQRRQPHTSLEVKSAKAEVTRCEREATRMDAIAAADRKAEERARLVADEETDAQTLRAQGIMLPEIVEDAERDGRTVDTGNRGRRGGAVGTITLTEIEDDNITLLGGIKGEGGVVSAGSPGAAWEERDYTHWAKNRMAELVREGGEHYAQCEHRWYTVPTSGGGAGGCKGAGVHYGQTVGGGDAAVALDRMTRPLLQAGSVRLTRLVEDKFDGHAMVKTKAGRRALYYELDVWCEWLARHEATGNTLRGMIRVYNVAQDTQFCPGGDTGTSYMYATSREGGPTIDASSAWVQEVMDETGELFEVLSGRVGVLLQELTLK